VEQSSEDEGEREPRDDQEGIEVFFGGHKGERVERYHR
jgi:hypothetical protein